jgi:hypothetical protein
MRQLPPTRAIGTSRHDRRPSGVCLLRSDPFDDVELHSAAECFIAQMRIRIVRDGHKPNEAEEQRPCCVPIEPVHVISSQKDRREQEGYQNSGSSVKIAGVTSQVSLLAFCQHHRRAFGILRHCSRWRNIGYPIEQQITLCEDLGHHPPPCAQAPVKALVPGLLPPYSRQLYSPRTLVLGDAALT